MYSNLGKYIKEKFFYIENTGTAVFPIIDKSFIKQFCQKYCITNDDFIKFIQKKSLWDIPWEFSCFDMLGLIGIQLYAASQMENADGFTSGNFRDRICSKVILNMDLADWDAWARENQDDLWQCYYKWCEINGFIIVNKCDPMYGKDRYVQYPKVHSSLILNQEDLKTIAYLFVQKNLIPNEDLSEQEFWRIIGKYHSNNSYFSSRSKRILNEDLDIANRQIYQYFLMWDGDYVNPYNGLQNSSLEKYRLYLYFKEDKWSIDIYNLESSNIEINLLIDNVDFSHQLSCYYTHKYSSCIVFKPVEAYRNYWEETRYIENHKEIGYALIMKNHDSLYYYRNKDVVAQFNDCLLIQIDYDHYPSFYSEERPYQLKGGLKIMHNTYLLGATPLLSFKEKIPYWIDGHLKNEYRGDVVLHLSTGKHTITIKGYKTIVLYVLDVDPEIHKWDENFKWNIIRKGTQSQWSSLSFDGNILGLDFEKMATSKILPTNKRLKLTQWSLDVLNKQTEFKLIHDILN